MNWITFVIEMEKDILNRLDRNQILYSDLPEMVQTPVVTFVAMAKGNLQFQDVPRHILTPAIVLFAKQLGMDIEQAPNDMVVWASQNNSLPILSLIPSKAHLSSVWQKAISIDASNYEYLDAKILAKPSNIDALVKCNSATLKKLPVDLVTEKLCFMALNSSAFKLSHVPSKFINKFLVERACSIHVHNFSYVPTHLITANLIEQVLKTTEREDVFNILFHIPEHLLSEQIIVRALQINNKAIRLIPKHKLSQSILSRIAPFINDFECFRLIPDHIYDAKIAGELVDINYRFLEYIPRQLKTLDICLRAIDQDGDAIANIPNELLTEETFKVALRKNGLALKHIPMPWRDLELPDIAVDQNGLALEFVPDELKTYNRCLKAVKGNPNAFYWVPICFQKPELLAVVLEGRPQIYENLQTHLKSLDLTKYAIERDSNLRQFAPISILAKLDEIQEVDG